ncbi:T9SS type A sorting domain-containing protein [Kaistella flava (ex Peng et al. 2021)]|uniref:T9SS type A sorting domain-containing protein n=1 Tax=Kaistella flava (ex Peng et al. 2021) TaxID=2038776 RepID=A0A7M2Y5J8_9FLAO|nr:T9SS type A sorting domain-containing protein [Kaistella flava (ex Peng et al. 2021)]QOW09380.1 T9SS type A sorting domain-containing protein [Kaistella flava (ex Peng et al. 2021)]
MKKLSTLFLSLLSVFLFSQFTSPGTGVTYNLNSLSAAAPTALVKDGTDYQMKANITITTGDVLLMDENTTLKIDGGLQLTIAGIYNTTASNFLITATNPAVIFKGIRLEEGSEATFKNTILEYGGGISCLTENFLMDNCTVRYFKSGLVTGAAVNFSRGNPVVTNSKFIDNDLPAVASGANLSVALEFTNNYLSGNTKLNSNRPQVNMGPSGSGTTKVLNNIILGDRTLTKVGGISVSSLLGVENNVKIEGNTVTDNRYGITVAGNASTGSISNNILTDNNSENIPNNGGSGISINGTGALGAGIKIEKNQIRGHLWGITIIGTMSADLGGGPLGSVGENIFKDNGNGGQLYALFNNTANPVSAKNNCWREGELSDDAMVEDVISHKVDDPALGLVNFKPYLCAKPLASVETKNLQASIYPNPSNGTFTLNAEKSGNVLITDVSGKVVYSGNVFKGKNTISVKSTSGVYFMVYQADGKTQSTKLMIK